jgi:hypothetical protein
MIFLFSSFLSLAIAEPTENFATYLIPDQGENIIAQTEFYQLVKTDQRIILEPITKQWSVLVPFGERMQLHQQNNQVMVFYWFSGYLWLFEVNSDGNIVYHEIIIPNKIENNWDIAISEAIYIVATINEYEFEQFSNIKDQKNLRK